MTNALIPERLYSNIWPYRNSLAEKSFLLHKPTASQRSPHRLELRSFHKATVNISGGGKRLPTSIDSSRLLIQLTNRPKNKPKEDPNVLLFGSVFTDHMLECEWDKSTGWAAPRIVPFHNLEISPAASSLQYALECFEGMKAYRSADGRIRLFRPEMNVRRLRSSAERVALPTFDEDELLKLICQLVRLEKDWVPSTHGFSLYIRPTVIATNTNLGVSAPNRALLYVILSPVGPYFKEGFKPVKLLADDTFVRSCPGLTGGFKVGSNYAGTIVPQMEAASKGYQQILWLYGPNGTVQEVGTMNPFFYWITPNGERELVTPPLDGTILPGVTRDSILTLARSSNLNVSERHVTIHDITRAVDEGRMLEAFGAGTAAIVCPIKCISYGGKDYNIATGTSGAGQLCSNMAESLMAIQYGKLASPWSHVVFDPAEEQAPAVVSDVKYDYQAVPLRQAA
eukprot:CAMPEP_0184666404 /NCGR_PEP_ID=MMETSP0308-20130426/61448_1 /TAXON_ID=38269 /ORGANISM="Gloeochaete witrockiana, Strain SAG 46.84" /LENGTH=453 /DNA_ID=CAMNT_0027110951 /DNA_START=144 /DNA_END=1505 /DNA_ORIENTATION=+